MRLAIVVRLTGTLVRLFSPAFLAPAALAAVDGQRSDVAGFLAGFAAAFGLGSIMRRAVDESAESLRMRRVEGFATASATWMALALVAAIPYGWAGLGPIDALFESMSGLTATGATVLTGFEGFGRAVFFWRALTHWLGGLGVIALFIAVLPRLAVGGRELFFAEAAGPSDEKLTPQLRQTASALWRVYGAFTAAQAVALWLAGMSWFDAVCHAFSTMSAGGFSTHPQSLAGYANPWIEWVTTVFMFIAGANFALLYRAVRVSRTALGQDEEFRVYTGIVIVATVLLTLMLVRDGLTAGEALRHGAFQVLSVLTTTGFASVDFNQWSDQARMILFLLMFVGGCAGSAAGGPKVVRHLLMTRFTVRELKRVLHPRAVLPVRLGHRTVPEKILRDVVVFMLFYLIAFAAGSTIVVALGADLLTGMTATIGCLGNIGPGFGAVGPMSNYADLHPVSRFVLTLEMWIGRLEVLTVLVLFRLESWRAARWTAT